MRLAWLVAGLCLLAPATAAHARAQTRWVCANQAVLDQGPGSHPFDNLQRGDRFVADRFARHGVWAHGTPVSYALGRRPVVRAHAKWIRVADLCPRGSVPWSALPPANAAGSFLGLRMAAGPAGVVYLADGGELVRVAVSRATGGGLSLRARALGHVPSTAFAAGPGGRLYVGAPQGVVRVYSPAGRFVRAFGRRGSASGELHQILAIAPAPAGDVFVTDTVGHITRFSATGAVLAQWGGRTAAAGAVTTPVSAVVDGDGDVDVLDQTAAGVRVKRFSADGALLAQWSPGAGFVEQLALAPDGNLVLAGNDGRVRVVTVEGRPVRDFPDGGRPSGVRSVAVGPDGRVYVLGDRLGAFGLDGTRVGVARVGQRYAH